MKPLQYFRGGNNKLHRVIPKWCWYITLILLILIVVWGISTRWIQYSIKINVSKYTGIYWLSSVGFSAGDSIIFITIDSMGSLTKSNKISQDNDDSKVFMRPSDFRLYRNNPWYTFRVRGYDFSETPWRGEIMVIVPVYSAILLSFLPLITVTLICKRRSRYNKML